MGKIQLLLFIQILFASVSTFSQIDSEYVQSQKDKSYIKTYIYQRNIGLKVEKNEENISYSSNNPMGLGVSISSPYLPFNISISHSLPRASKNKNIKTKSFDLQVHKYARKYVLDAVFKRYTGFYIDNSNLTLLESLRPQMHISKIGVNGQYIFNNTKFSYPAAYNQSEVQLKSAGSILLGGNLYFIKTVKDEGFLNDPVQNTKNWHLGLNTGYSYNWVLHKKWLINGSVSLGGNIIKKGVVPTALCRASYFYNSTDWSMGFWVYADFIQIAKINKTTYGLTSGYVCFSWVKHLG